MDWLTKELTPIDKVRRNVILLAALAGLLSYFPVQTDAVSFLGARFTSEVVAFGLFHALCFYGVTMVVRAGIHSRVADVDFDRFEIEEHARSKETEKFLEEARAQAIQANADLHKTYLESLERVRAELADLRLRRLELGRMRSRRLPTEDMEDDLAIVRELQIVESQIQYNEVEQTRLESRATSDSNEGFILEVEKRRLRRVPSMSTAKMLATFVFFGEYLLPVALALIGGRLLLQTHDFPMLWELHLRTR